MMQLQDLDLLKDIPGYRAILRAVLKSQIQLLVEQLCEQTGEESVILTASVSDGTLCHLGSFSGKDFLEGREEIKSQFLRHCLKKQHRNQREEIAAPYRPKERRLSSQCETGSSATSTYLHGNHGNHARPMKTQFKQRQKLSQSYPSRGDPGFDLPSVQTGTEVLNSDLGFGTSNNVNQSKQDVFQTGSFVTNDFVVKPENDHSNSLPQSSSHSSPSTADTSQTADELPSDKVAADAGSNGSGHNEDSFTEGSQSGATIIVKQEPADDDISITGVETAVAPDMGVNQSVYGSDWVPPLSDGQDFSSQLAAGSNPYGNTSFGAGDQSFSGYTPARLNAKGDNSIYHPDSNDHLSDADLDLATVHAICNTSVPGEQHSLHLQRHQKISKKFPCNLCGKSFSQKCDLKRHLVIHTGERFFCSLCPKSFSQKHQRNLHELTHKIAVM